MNFWHVLTLNVVDIHQIMIISFFLTPFDQLNFQNTKNHFFRIFGVPKGTKKGTSGGQIKNLKTLSWHVPIFRIFPHFCIIGQF